MRHSSNLLILWFNLPIIFRKMIIFFSSSHSVSHWCTSLSTSIVTFTWHSLISCQIWKMTNKLNACGVVCQCPDSLYVEFMNEFVLLILTDVSFFSNPIHHTVDWTIVPFSISAWHYRLSSANGIIRFVNCFDHIERVNMFGAVGDIFPNGIRYLWTINLATYNLVFLSHKIQWRGWLFCCTWD